MSDNVVPARDTSSSSLSEIALLFLKLGTTAFGGPAAHIAMMDEEVVRRRHWLTEQEFLDYLSAVNFIPGPNSTEMAIHIGHRRGGWPGLMMAGTCFIVPAAILVGILAWAYVRWGALPQAASLLYGVKPVVIAVVLQALVETGPLGGQEQVAGTGCNPMHRVGRDRRKRAVGAGDRRSAGTVSALERAAPAEMVAGAPTFKPALSAAGVIAAGASVGLWPIFLIFAKIGSVLFGSGYVLLAFLRADLVERYHWLTQQQLLDAVAVGQVTPGPVFTTATFVGYLLHGPSGAIAATVGIFLPAFLFVALSAPSAAATSCLAHRRRHSRWNQCGLAGPYGARNLAIGARGVCGLVHLAAGNCERGRADPLSPHQFSVAGAGSGNVGDCEARVFLKQFLGCCNRLERARLKPRRAALHELGL